MSIVRYSPSALNKSVALLGASVVILSATPAFALTYDMSGSSSTYNSTSTSYSDDDTEARMNMIINSDVNDQTTINDNGFVDESGGTSSLQNILRTFGKPGWRSSNLYDNMSLETSAFDFVALRSHRCFDPRGLINQRGCARMFGRFSPLRNAVANADLQAAIVAQFGSSIVPLWSSFHTEVGGAALASVAPPAFGGFSTTPRSLSDQEIRNRFRNRSHMLWDFCNGSFPNDRGRMSSCYQDNVRILQGDADINQQNLGLSQY